MRKTFKHRLLPSAAQERVLRMTLEECRWLYNQLLEQRKTAYEERGEMPTLYEQQATFGALKEERVSLGDVHSQVLQNVAVRLDLAFKAFFRRVKASETPGYPRFRGYNRYDSFCYPQSGFRVNDKRVYLSKIGHVKAVLHRPLNGMVKTCCVQRTRTGKWFVAFSCEVEDAPLPATASAVGIDVGLTTFATMSDGREVATPRFFRRDEHDLARAQCRFSEHPTPEKGHPSTRERRRRAKIVARIHERIANRRRNFAHQESRKVVNTYDTIAVEDLSINRMAHNHCLAKSIHDAAWAMFTAMVAYKAACAGRRFIAVNPAYTSQTCSGCGHRQKMPLSERTYQCPCCHLSIGRDVNAAKNILAVGLHSIGEGPLKPTALAMGAVTSTASMTGPVRASGG